MNSYRLAAPNAPVDPTVSRADGRMATSWCGSTMHAFAHITKRRSRPTEPFPT